MDYDLSGTQDAMAGVKSSVVSVVPYVDAMANLPLGPQQIVLEGQVVGSWTPLALVPGMAAALQTIQQHCTVFQYNVLYGLHNFPWILALLEDDGASSGIQCDLSTILTILNQLAGSDAPPTASQRQIVNGALADLNSRIGTISQLLTPLPTATATFLSELPGDIQTLTEGTYGVTNAINLVNRAYQNAVVQYGAGPMGTAICQILAEITSQIIVSLQSIQNAINAAVVAEQSVAGAWGTLQDIFTALGSDYTNTTEAITSASDAQFASALQELDVQDAQFYWQNASSFATANGLGY